jgi:outer membrane protein OmpA-like peptidoglycan-associated protein
MMRKTAKPADPGLRLLGVQRLCLAWALALSLPLAGAACSSASRSKGNNSVIQGQASEDEDYPNLSRVPGEQPRPTPESLRKDLVEGLMADHANARYTDELLTSASAAPPPAPPPTAAKPQVEIIWETLEVQPKGQTETVEEETVSVDEAPAAGEADAAADKADKTEDQVQIVWDTERVEPNGKVAVAGRNESGEELLLAPQPELVAVVYFPQDSSQVAKSDQERLEDVVALYKERGGRLRLVGHAGGQADTGDQVAQRMANLELSLESANAVATTLLDLGADKEELLVEAKADDQPAGSEAVVKGASNDRRVEIFLEH